MLCSWETNAGRAKIKTSVLYIYTRIDINTYIYIYIYIYTYLHSCSKGGTAERGHPVLRRNPSESIAKNIPVGDSGLRSSSLIYPLLDLSTRWYVPSAQMVVGLSVVMYVFMYVVFTYMYIHTLSYIYTCTLISTFLGFTVGFTTLDFPVFIAYVYIYIG